MDIDAWSGTLFHMRQALQRTSHRVCLLDACAPRNHVSRCVTFLKNLVSSQVYIRTYSHARQAAFKKHFERQLLDKGPFDLIIAPAATAELGLLTTSIPIVYINDSTFALRNNYYWYYKNLSGQSVRESNACEQRVLEKSALCVFSSHWAAGSATSHYGISPQKVVVVPFGANIDCGECRGVEPKTLASPLELLFVGKDWERKGGDVAVDCFRELSRSLDVRLTIVGSVPPGGPLDGRITVIPHLDKTYEADRARLKDIYRKATFMLLPTRADCSPMVVTEAFAHATPVLATRTGGVAELVTDGVNGYLIPPASTGAQYASRIKHVLTDASLYTRLSRNALEHSATSFNWDQWAQALMKAITNHLT
jgi:glycosyltransferase involved in cell wall biosynthesis